MSTKEVVKESAGSVVGGGLPVAAVAVAGELGVSAVGLTTGLATLGFGSMLCGVGVVALIGIGGYVGTKALVEWAMED